MIVHIKKFLFINTNNKQTILKNTFWLFVAEGLQKGSIFVVSILLARMLGPEQFGIYGFVTSIVGVLIIFTNYGLIQYTVREVSKHLNQLSAYFVSGLALKGVLALITFGIGYIVCIILQKPDIYTTYTLLFLLYALCIDVSDYMKSFFRPLQHMQHEAYVKSINGIINISLLIFVLLKRGTLQAVFYGFVLAGVSNLCVTFLYTTRTLHITWHHGVYRSDLLSPALRSGFFIMGGILAVTLFNSADQIMLGYLRTNYELGLYTAAYKIIYIVVIISGLVMNAMYPFLTQLFEERERFQKVIKRIAGLSLVGSLLFILGNILIADHIVVLVFGNGFAEATIVYSILICTTLFIGLNNVFGTGLLIAQKEKEYFLVVLCALFVNILLNRIYIPMYGISAAAITTVFTEGISFLGYYAVAEKSFLRKPSVSQSI